MAENFPNLGKETDTQIQEASRVPNKITKRLIPVHWPLLLIDLFSSLLVKHVLEQYITASLNSHSLSTPYLFCDQERCAPTVWGRLNIEFGKRLIIV